GMVVLAVADVVLAVGSGLAALFAGAALWGLHMALSQGLLSALVADVAPAAARGTAFGVFNRNHSAWAAGRLSLTVPALQDRGVLLVHFDEVREGLDSEVCECHHPIVGVPVDPDDTVFGVHLVGDITQPVHALAKFPRNTVDRLDGINLVDVHHAAWAG
ncbi:MAG: hypothetical protein KGO02_03950, partial [Alphaproteobacteria bacterium]|nr:hypothetical protein [Alphaproteobacteria bacterium]